MNRVIASVVALALGSTLGAAAAQAQAPAPAAPKATGKVAVFNVAKVMRDYQKWQAFAKVMGDKRNVASASIVKSRSDMAAKQQAMTTEVIPSKKEEMAKELVVMQRNLEDLERTVSKQLNDESAGYLKNLFLEIQTCVKAVVDAYGFDVVFAYPDALTDEERTSPMYFDLKMRPTAAMPFYVSPNADITQALIETLNKHFPPAQSVTQTGATAPVPPKP